MFRRFHKSEAEQPQEGKYGKVYSGKNKGHKDSRRSVTDIRKFFFYTTVITIALITINSSASGHTTLIRISKETISMIKNVSNNLHKMNSVKPTKVASPIKTSKPAKTVKSTHAPIKHNIVKTKPALARLTPINTGTLAKQLYSLTANYTSFGSAPGQLWITEGSNRIRFSVMTNATGDNTIAPRLPSWRPDGPGKTTTFASLDSSIKAISGSFGAGSGRSWCLVLQQGKIYLKLSNLAIKTTESLIRPTCVKGK